MQIFRIDGDSLSINCDISTIEKKHAFAVCLLKEILRYYDTKFPTKGKKRNTEFGLSTTVIDNIPYDSYVKNLVLDAYSQFEAETNKRKAVSDAYTAQIDKLREIVKDNDGSKAWNAITSRSLFNLEYEIIDVSEIYPENKSFIYMPINFKTNDAVEDNF